ncbi:hypothetical protein CXB51_003787 [Gossypium anomalum]|uniref:Uncharacterized protein n=1 Tax=Gossypium anomalum TaxID=47600 RepID=A0A8J6A0W9_9ROSI|nr:hypothetical protein CXB51_003787 [Gossypium anomalum]
MVAVFLRVMTSRTDSCYDHFFILKI